MDNQRATTNRRWLEYGWLISGLLATCCLVFQAAPVSLTCAKVVAETTADSGSKLLTRNIEAIRVGDRVIADPAETKTKAVDLFGDPPSWDSEAVDPTRWKKVTLVHRADDVTVHIVLLRPSDWINDTGAWVGSSVHVILPEQDVDGDAEVLSIEDCPPIAHGSGSVVTGTFTRVRPGILNLYVAGLEKPIGVTANHSIYSVDRGEFVHAGDLSEGEKLRLLHGNGEITRVEPIEGGHRVYNLEVHGTHVYRVSTFGVLVHNGSAKAEEEAAEKLIDASKKGIDKFRRAPANLAEKLAMDEANGGAGKKIMDGLHDPRYKGMEKWQHIHRNPDGTNTVIHYVRDPQTGNLCDFKFKDD